MCVALCAGPSLETSPSPSGPYVCYHFCRGWRDWNEYGGDITQEIMLSTMYAIAAPFPGTNISLASLGYRDVGLDDVWQQCGS